MTAPDSVDVTQLLKAWGGGDNEALERLTTVLYGELRRLARAYVRRERVGGSMQSAALVNEAYLRLIDAKRTDWRNRAQFFAVAATIMRRILVDAARRRTAAKRGGAAWRDDAITPSGLDEIPGDRDTASKVCALDDALESLAAIDPRRAHVVEMRFFGGLTVDETAAALNISPQSVMRDWRLARSWLMRELEGKDR